MTDPANKDSSEIPATSMSSPSSAIRNPYKKAKHETTPARNVLTPEQQERIQANRAKALQLRQEKERQEQIALQCQRCKAPSNKNELCIVWKHSNDELEKERSIVGKIFRSPCCQRVDPQPCFIGTHLEPGQTITTPSYLRTTVNCECGEQARLARTAKKSLNYGRYYYRCWVPVGTPLCNFFQWADVVHGLPVNRPALSVDGIAEWVHPHADPFDEDLCHGHAVVHADRARQRLIAACLIRQLVLAVTDSPYVQTSQPVTDLLHTVNDVLSGHTEAIVQHLWPLTLAQIQKRFGVEHLEAVSPVTRQEFQLVLDQVLERNPVMRATVRQLIPGELLDVSVLGNYCSV